MFSPLYLFKNRFLPETDLEQGFIHMGASAQLVPSLGWAIAVWCACMNGPLDAREPGV